MKALLLIDIQNGFCPGGNLAVADGDRVVPIANALIDNGGYDLIVASQDWHPENHGSFASQHPGKKPFDMGELSGKPQMMWPDHCVQGTPDAEFHPDLKTETFDYIQQKGENPAVDSYSAFRDNDQGATTGLADYLNRQGITQLDVCGLATDYCVSFSVLDALDMLPDVQVRFIEDASRGIDPQGIKAAITTMREKGAIVLKSRDILRD
ncbi:MULTISPECIES: bifunctional nicotinamidase/pyrazinamidase [Agrobacterium]|uniref:Nicotinamidase n=2 Tax=Agrobacterium tumefaciens TaxID=358 RepID=A0AAW8LRV8_AGRTU|nr:MULTISPECIES: bifunctional nicotinamidase/pyrazinamidase [Agrobacterium]AYM05945.1 pyrazinamidase/nicotinamidase [Agrobacterium tumefaciens]EHH07665.1 pyrazinamidase / nicotinamidase [Agrobacterium tumefaciens CCNWGS0286]KWT83349.1 nicotinamidase [Agrobacterium tumefaciens str. B6]MBP2535165.1 nicotinamidase/pyrazinamidase [Agrobacterium tumefaciens]MBP2566884.1 nicotinamidase/pyrazinamidase [Agrobacterium tumefaciens]